MDVHIRPRRDYIRNQRLNTEDMVDDYKIDEQGADGESLDLDALFARWSDSDDKSSLVRPVDPPIPMPSSIDLQRGAGRVRIVRRWFSPSYAFVAIFAAVWNAFVLLFLVTAVLGGGWFIAVFMIPFLVVGGFLAYSALSGILNTSTIDLADGALTISHRPIPWRTPPVLRSNEITQLYSVEKIHHHSSSRSGGTRRTSTSYVYEVHVLYGPENRDVKLIGNLSELNQARFIEHTIERQLGIVDREIRGEVRRDSR